MNNLTSAGSKALAELRSSEHAALLNAIDGLRDVNIDPTEISIPQIVVCGSQSSGKSSVLEALARVPFPTGAGTKTLFPTEVILRNAPTAGTTVTIIPAPNRSIEQVRILQRFKKEEQDLGQDAFIRLHDEAAKVLAELELDCGLWSDRLRVEIRGPDQPHLTLVDLPGLIQNADKSKRQTQKDVVSIREIASEYLRGSRTIVLAVINARYDVANQEVMNLISSVDGARDRTLGIITNPDGSPSTDATKNIIDFAKGRSTQFGLGWHVVKNMSHEAVDRTPETRDAEEANFLSSGPWQSLARKDVGIGNLRTKLSQSLLDCIRKELPALLTEMETKLSSCRRIQDQLGPERVSELEQRIYLTEIAMRYQDVVKAALDGRYNDPSLGEDFSSARNSHLRDEINIKNDEFASRLKDSSYLYSLVNDIPVPSESSKQNDEVDEPRGRRTRVKPTDTSELLDSTIFHAPYTLDSDEMGPRRISAWTYCRRLSKFMEETRGKNLPGMVSTSTITTVFRQQSSAWEKTARAHILQCFGISRSFVSDAITHIAGPDTAGVLLNDCIGESLDGIADALEDKLAELLWPYQKSHPQATRQATREIMQEGIPAEGSTSSLTWTVAMKACNADPDMIQAALALDKAEAYYVVALETLTENIATLAIERQLLNSLPGLFTPTLVATLSKERLEMLANEPEQAKKQRETTKREIEALKEVIWVCKNHIGHPGTVRRHRLTTPRRKTAAESGHTTPKTPASIDEAKTPVALEEKTLHPEILEQLPSPFRWAHVPPSPESVNEAKTPVALEKERPHPEILEHPRTFVFGGGHVPPSPESVNETKKPVASEKDTLHPEISQHSRRSFGGIDASPSPVSRKVAKDYNINKGEMFKPNPNPFNVNPVGERHSGNVFGGARNQSRE
ncbi:interferon-induced gtp-binding protein mx [Acrodontium crateriforme]|uniref:Interferon-induced gtp-binding protein mx n=1 Tax=Acrodontium crateriforme TaxID=150365 RepID=A0AAQ3RAG8_9PEZI|nr:interferon-induced gtp-binding protein mx [Acrodontium crateriforme]